MAIFSWKRASRLERILIISVATSAIFIIGFWLSLKRPNRDYYLPANFEGWVTIRHSMPNAPALPAKDGVLQIVVPDSGVVHTASPWDYGWGRDRYFWRDSTGKVTQIPSSVFEGNETKMYVFLHEYRPYAHSRNFAKLPTGETRFPDGAVVKKFAETDIDYTRGKKSVETFYLTAKPQSIMYSPPKNTRDLTVETKEFLPTIGE